MGVESQGSGLARNRLSLGPVCSGVLWRNLQQFQPHLRHSRVDQANLPGYAIGYINFASFLIGTAIIDAHNFKFAVARVNDAHPGTEGQVGVRRGQTFGIEPLPVGGPFPVELRSIPTGIANPYLYGLDRRAQVGNQGGLDSGAIRNIKGTQRIAAQIMKSGRRIVCSFRYELLKKCSTKYRIMSTVFSPEVSSYLTDS